MNLDRSQNDRASLRAKLLAGRHYIDCLVDALADEAPSDERCAAVLEEMLARSARGALPLVDDADAPRTFLAAAFGTSSTACLEDEARMFRALVDASPNGVLLRSLPGASTPIAFANAALREMLGPGADPGVPVYPMLDVAPDELERLVTGDVEFVRRQTQISGPRLASRPVTISSFVVRDPAGAPWLVATTVIDTTEAQRVSDELCRQARIIARQQAELLCAKDRALSELASPLIPVADRVLVLPLIGVVDRARLEVASQAVLEGISRHRAHTAIVDLTGVRRFEAADLGASWATLVGSARMLGARVLLSGIGPDLAAPLAELPIALPGVTFGTLLSAIRAAARGA